MKRKADEAPAAAAVASAPQPPPRRSGREPKPRDKFVKEIIVPGGYIETTRDEVRGLKQPGAMVRTDEQEEFKNKQFLGDGLCQRLKEKGWNWYKSIASPSGFVFRAPGIRHKEQELNVNAFFEQAEIWDQYLKDGKDIDKMVERARQSGATDRNEQHAHNGKTTEVRNLFPESRVESNAPDESIAPRVATNQRAEAPPRLRVAVKQEDVNEAPQQHPPPPPVSPPAPTLPLTILQRLDRLEEMIGVGIGEGGIIQRLKRLEEAVGLGTVSEKKIPSRILALEGILEIESA